ncbi:VWA domain-containing protein [Microbacterium hominis]|uniref:Substrate-binding domain-containing protein n=1 Tax=Microbacterium hominis TaxID=162426 RepID=A0A7D4THF9_9MICO|nr:VWA domain-containing protein [Microbacterium hominis]QKJ20860.1 substrate-binding domain-containing protein [Microbacterium hominis]
MSMNTSAIEERRARRRRRRRTFVLWTSIVAIVVMVGAIGTVGTLVVSALASADEPDATAEQSAADAPEVELIEFPEDEPAATAGTGPCTTVPVLSSFENAGMVDALAAAYNAAPRNVAGTCVTVTADKKKSGVAASLVADGFPTTAADAKPTVWLPDATTWLDVAAAEGATSLRAEGPSAGSSNVVLAMPQPLAAAIGWDEAPPTWAEVFEAAEDEQLWGNLGHPEWGAFKLGKTSPLVATSGEAAMFASFGSSAGDVAALTAAQVADPAVEAEVRAHELATSHYMATPEHFLWHARQAEETGGSAADFLSAVIVDEKSVWDYNRGITSRDGVTRVEAEAPAEQLVPIYPSDGHYAADNPVIRLSGDWIDPVESEAAADFVRFVGTAQGQAAVRTAGYRDLNGQLDAGVAELAHLTETPSTPIAMPDADVVTAVHAAFPDVRKRANVLFLVDVSGSMDEKISATETKLTAAQDAIALALDHFTTGDSVGLAAFAQAADGSLVPGNLAPVADIGSSRDAFLSSLNGLTSMGDTPLYQAVDTFAAQQAAAWTSDRINAIVLLSDGEDDPLNAPTIGEAEMLENLGELHHSTPVLIFTLAYGEDADVPALQAISKATGAHYYDATDPTEVEEVLGDLVTSF